MRELAISHRQRVHPEPRHADRQSAVRVRERRVARYRRRCRRWRVSSISRRRPSSCPPRAPTAQRADLHAELRDAVRRPSHAGHRTRLPRARPRRRRPEAGDAGRHHSGAGRRRSLDAAGECTDLARVRSVARHAREDAGTRPTSDIGARPAVGQSGQGATRDSADQRARRAQRAPRRHDVRRRAERGRPQHGVRLRRARAARPAAVALLLPGRQRDPRRSCHRLGDRESRRLDDRDRSQAPVPFRDLAGRICRASVDAAARCRQRAAGFS